ncbi:MAG: DUF6798 domain-containing protein [Xenococcaceae cyanobacterium]
MAINPNKSNQEMISSQKVDFRVTIALYIVVIVYSLIIYGYSFLSSNIFSHIPYIRALLDPELYTQDFYVREFLQFTPRYYYQHLIALTTKAGLSIPLTYFLYYVVAFSSFIVGLYTLGKKFGKSSLSGAVLAFLVLTGVEGTVGYTSIFRNEPTPATFAMGLSIWGIYFCFCQRWIVGYFLFGLACLLQFLVGFLPGLLFAPILLLNSLKNHNLKLLILPLGTLGIVASLVVVPMVMTGNTSSDSLSNANFIYWYGYVRNPHHIILSTFPVQNWRSFIFLTLGGILCIKSSSLLHKDEKLNFLLIIFTTYFALCLGYIFVEIYPFSFMAKLQLARTTPFVQLIILIVISVIFSEYYQQSNLAICMLLFISPVIKNGTILFFIVALGLVFLRSIDRLEITRSKLFCWITLTSLFLILALYPLPNSTWDIFNRIFQKVILFGVLSLPFLVENKFLFWPKIRLTIWSLAVLSSSYFMMAIYNILPRQFPAVKIPQIPSSNLGLKFRDRSSKDALILVPPSQDRFRVYSERSVVFTFRGSPFTDRGIKEWSNRLKLIIDVPEKKINWSKIDSKYRNLSDGQLTNIAKKHGANYILTNINWHAKIKGYPIAQEGKWIIYKINN